MGKLQSRLGDELSLYVRMLAFLQAVPRPPEGSRRAKREAGEQLSRFEGEKRLGVTPPMPPNPAPHISNRLVEMGLVEPGLNGATPLSWREIDAWCARTSIDLPPWEGRLIRRLSADYLAESRRAELETCPAPWRSPVTAAAKRAEVAILDLVLG